MLLKIFLGKVLVIPEKVVPLHPQNKNCKDSLGYGVMVTLQILVLPFLVRVRVPQPREKENPANWRDFSFLFFVLSVDSLDFLSDEIHIVFQLLNFTVHFVDETIALLR